MEMILGKGCVSIAVISRDGKIGLLLEQLCEPHDIDSRAIITDTSYIPKDSDIIVWTENLESARVLQDMVNRLCLNLNGCRVEDI